MLQARGHGAGDAPELMVCRAAARDVVFGRVHRCLGEMACAGGVPILKTAACSDAWSSPHMSTKMALMEAAVEGVAREEMHIVVGVLLRMKSI